MLQGSLQSLRSISQTNILPAQVNKFFWNEEEQEKTFSEELNGILSLSYKKRIIAFATCLALGLFFCFLSTFFLVMPKKFAKLYTFGSIALISSTGFLVGPRKQLQNMLQPARLSCTLIYFSAIVGTLWAAIAKQSTILTLIMVVIQFGSALWYGASYIPLCQRCIMSTVSRFV